MHNRPTPPPPPTPNPPMAVETMGELYLLFIYLFFMFCLPDYVLETVPHFFVFYGVIDQPLVSVTPTPPRFLCVIYRSMFGYHLRCLDNQGSFLSDLLSRSIFFMAGKHLPSICKLTLCLGKQFGRCKVM